MFAANSWAIAQAVCATIIEADLSIGTVCRALSVADKHQAEALKETCIGFIVQHFREVRHGPRMHSESDAADTSCIMAALPSPRDLDDSLGALRLWRRLRQVHSTDGFRELPRSLLDLVHQGISQRLACVSDAGGAAPGSGGGAGSGVSVAARTPGAIASRMGRMNLGANP